MAYLYSSLLIGNTFKFTFIFCTVAYFHYVPSPLPATPTVPYPSHAALRRPSWSEESLQDVSLSQSNQSVKTNQCQNKILDILTPTSLRYMTFFSWFLRRSWSSFFSFSSCSTCFAIMKSGSSSSMFCKYKCVRITSELRTFLVRLVDLPHHTLTTRGNLKSPIDIMFMFNVRRQLKYLGKTHTGPGRTIKHGLTLPMFNCLNEIQPNENSNYL